VIGTTLGPYAIERELGSGGMGMVYAARVVGRAPGLAEGTVVAVKVIHPHLLETPGFFKRFLREAEIGKSVVHPNVVRTYDCDAAIAGGRQQNFLVMEYVEGRTLRELLADEGRVPEDLCRHVAREVTRGLAAIHAAGVVHRDMKPENVLITEDRAIKVMDLGVARLNDEVLRLSQTGAFVGSIHYAAPECFTGGGRNVDGRADLHALGLLLYELASGVNPYFAPSVPEILKRVMHEEPSPLRDLAPEVSPFLSAVVRCLLAKNPDGRFPDAATLLAVLEQGEESAWWRSQETAAGSAQAPKPPSLPASRLDESDVVIAYAPMDDVPAVVSAPGWISRLHRNLEIRVAQLAGAPVTMVKQPDVAEDASRATEVLEQVPHAQAVVSILSPSFVRAPGCVGLVEAFWRRKEETGTFRAPGGARLFNIVKTPVEEGLVPAAIRSLYSDLAPYEFFDRDPVSGRVRVFDEDFGELAGRRFHERVYDVAHDLAQVLRQAGGTPANGAATTPGTKTIFLAATTSDLEPRRDQLRRELTELGHEVLPRGSLPMVAGEIETVVRSCLERADLAIHLVGAHYGLVPEATDLSVVALQNRVAADVSRATKLRRIVWTPRDLVALDERQKAFLRQLEEGSDAMEGAELIASTLESLKTLLLDRWRREREAASPAAPPVSTSAATVAADAPRLYLLCDVKDLDAIEPLEDFLYDQGIEVSLPGFEAGEAEAQAVHVQNLRDCDAALVYYGAAGMHWADFSVRDLAKAAGYRDSRPIPVSAVYVAPPFGHRKERFRSVSVPVLRQPGETFDPAALADFVASVRAAKGGA